MANVYPFAGTFWKPSFLRVQSHQASAYEFYAVVKSREDPGIFGSTLVAWKLEYRGNAIEHPAYGMIPIEYCDDYDLFVEQTATGKSAEFEFNWPSNTVQLMGDDIKYIIQLFKY